MLSIETLSAGYPGVARVILDQVSAEAKSDAFICLLGRNGAGKSTLLRTLAGLQPPVGGDVKLNGESVFSLAPTERAQRLAVVLTERVQAVGLSAIGLVQMGRQPFTGWFGQVKKADVALAHQALEAVGGGHLAQRMLDSLSDGERQRVMIARALAQTPSLLVLDEVTAFLDLPGRVSIMMLLRKYAREHGCVVILSSHDLDLSLQLADQVWLLPGTGALITGIPEALAHSGAIGCVFDAQPVRFSPKLGAFEVNEPVRGLARVDGEPQERLWVERLLRRHGFQLASSGNVDIHVSMGGPTAGRAVTPSGEQGFIGLDQLQHLVLNGVSRS